MRRNQLIIRLGSPVAMLLTVSLLGTRGSGQMQETDVPYVLRDRVELGHLRRGHQAGSIHTNVFDRAVKIAWKASAIQNAEPDWSLIPDLQTGAAGTHAVRSTLQQLPVRYFPTAACALGDSALIVAGLAVSGDTVIERWELAWPETMPEPITDSASGLDHVPVVTPSVSQVARFHAEDIPGRRIVKAMHEVVGRQPGDQRILVLFDDSNDLYLLNPHVDWASQSPVLVASSTDPAGTPGHAVPSLTGNLSGIWFGDREGIGFVYQIERGHFCMVTDPPPGDPSNPPFLVLVDTERDGSIDAMLEVDASDWVADGWASLESYSSWWLRN